MNIGIVGLGLIGASVAKALKKRGEDRVFVWDKDPETMKKAELLELYHEILGKDNAKEIDLLVLCTYPRAIEVVLAEYAPLLKSGAIVVDCGGNKRRIVDKMLSLHQIYPDINFVGAHPMAGREFSGISHSTYTLFEKSSVLVVPVKSEISVLYTVKKFFLSIGAERIVITDAKTHDEMISYTSQLAHIVSSAYVKSDLAEKHYGYSAGSFRDMTRVAKINAKMWSEIMCDNRDFLVEQLEVLEKNIKDIKDALKENNEERVRELLEEGNAIKTKVEENRVRKLNETGFKGE